MDSDEFVARIDEVTRLARLVTANYRSQAVDDFVDDAPAIIFQQLTQFDSDIARFEIWCAAVLRRMFIDRWRRRSTRDRHEKEIFPAGISAGSPSSQAAFIEAELRIDMAVPFSPSDHVQICSWTPLVTVVLLATHCLHSKFDQNEWNARLARSNAARPFPCDELNIDDHLANLAVVATALGRRADSIQRMYLRNRDKLARLDFIRSHLAGDDYAYKLD